MTGNLLCGTGFGVTGGQLGVTCYGKTITLSDDLSLADYNVSSMQFISPSGRSGIVLDGGGHTVNLSGLSSFVFNSNITATLRNMTLVLSYGIAIDLADATVALTLDNVNVVMSPATSQYYGGHGTSEGGSWGQIFIKNNVRFFGPGATFIYNTNKPLYITSGATLSFEPGTTYQHYMGSAYGIAMADATSTLRFNNCNLSIPSDSGLQIKKGRIEFDNLVQINNVSFSGGVPTTTTNTSSSLGLMLGDGIAANNVAVTVLSGAYVIVNGALYYNQG